MGRRHRKNAAARKGQSFKHSAVDVYNQSDDDRREGEVFDDVIDGLKSKDFADEEIDEDTAFNAEDNEKYGHLFAKNGDAQDEDEEEDDLEGEETMDLSEMIRDSPNARESDENSEEEQEEEEEEEEEEKVEEDDEESLKKLGSFVEKLSAQDSAAQNRIAKKKLRKIGMLHSGIGSAESKFGGSSGASEVGIADLLNALNQSSETGDSKLGTLRSKLGKLTTDKNVATLHAPLNSFEQAKLERAVGTDRVDEQLSKWDSVVQKNREKKHIVFPLREENIPAVSTASLISKFEPSNSFEQDLKQLRDLYSTTKTVANPEDRKVQSVEKSTRRDMEKRQRKIAEMRSILFYQEIKAKHMKRIKSKTYRKKKKLSNGDYNEDESEVSLRELEAADSGVAEEERANQERERAEARMNLRQQKSTKWLKNVQRFASRDDSRLVESIKDTSRASEALRRKMSALKDDLLEDNGDLHGALKEYLQDEHARAQEHPMEEEKSGLFSMGFMKKASAKRRAEAEQLLKEMESVEVDQTSSSAAVQDFIISGFTRFNSASIPAKTPLANDPTPVLKEEEKQKVDNLVSQMSFAPRVIHDSHGFSTKSDKPLNVSKKIKTKTNIGLTQEVANPFLSDGQRSGSSLEKSATNVMLDTSQVMSVADCTSSEAENTFTLLNSSQQNLVEEAFNDHDEIDELRKEKEQMVDKEFAAEEEAAGIGVGLPGWGSWAGEGVKISKRKRKAIKKEITEKKAAIAEKKENKLRKLDKGMSHVMFSEKQCKKTDKYHISALPAGVKSEDQLSKVLAIPLGKEWNSISSFKELNTPKIKTKIGKIIDPISWRSAKKLNPEINEDPNSAVVEAQIQMRQRRKEAQKKSKLTVTA